MERMIVKKSEIAAAVATRRLEVWLSYEDFRDVKQSAALGFWKGWCARPALPENERIGYAYKSAINQAIQFIIRRLFAKNPMRTRPLDDLASEAPPKEPRGDLPPDVRRRLYEIFLNSRKKKGQRGRLAAMREVFIVNAVYRGDNDDSIAQDLGIPRDHAKAYRLRARGRLEAYCKKEGI